MKKISSFTLAFIFMLSFVVVSLISPQKANAATSSPSLQSKASKIQKLEFFKKCVDGFLEAGFAKTTSPFDKDSESKQIYKVGHLVDSENGKWACSDGGPREEQLFKLLFVNGSEKNSYTGFYNGNTAYTLPESRNVKNVVGDDKPFLKFINIDNSTKYDLNKKDDGLSLEQAKSKINKQIQRTINFQLNVDEKEIKALRYENLSASFFGNKACNAKKITNINNAANDVVKVGDTSYEVGDNTGLVSVGYGRLGTEDGDLNCENIANQLSGLQSSWNSVTDTKGQIPPGAVTGDSGTSAATDDNSCEAKSGVTAWFACPFVAAAGEALNWIDEQINTYMVISPDLYKDSDSLYQAWTAFRNIALSLLIAAMMVIVISTALSLSFLDAYTVKKAFPRLVVSIIFILLSWWVCVFLIDLINVIGQGILGLMTSPFPTDSLGALFEPNAGSAVGSWAILGLGGFFAAAVPGTIGILGSWIGAGLLVLLAAYVTLIARQMFIIVLIIFSPLAILAWIFPASSKAWRFWWEGFIKALLMYPMVMALIGAGRIFSSVAGNSAEGLLGAILKLTAYIIPYAFIPFTFKAAGGLFGNFAGMVNNRSKGGFDRLRKVRQKNAAEMGQRAKAGELTRNDSGLNRRVNNFAAGALQNPLTGAGFSSKGKANIERLRTARKEQLLKESGVNSMMMDDDVRGVLLAGEDKADAFLTAKGFVKGTKEYNDIMGTARSIGFTGSSRAAAMDGESTHGKGRNMAAMASIYGKTDENAAMLALVDDIATSSGMTNSGRTRLLQNTMYNFGTNGRGDLRSKDTKTVMEEKFDPAIIRGITDTGMKSLAGAEVGMLLTGATQVEKEQALAQLLAINESRTSLSEPAIKALDAELTRAGVDLGSSESLDIQLAKQIAPPADSALFTAAQATLKYHQDVALSYQARGQAVPPATTDAIIQATADLTLKQRPIIEIAQKARAQSATYSSSLPIQSREQP